MANVYSTRYRYWRTTRERASHTLAMARARPAKTPGKMYASHEINCKNLSFILVVHFGGRAVAWVGAGSGGTYCKHAQMNCAECWVRDNEQKDRRGGFVPTLLPLPTFDPATAHAARLSRELLTLNAYRTIVPQAWAPYCCPSQVQ